MKRINLEVKPLSNNKMWQGRRFKSVAYKDYEIEVSALLPRKAKEYRIEGPVEVFYIFYLKNYKMTDYDNLIKPLQDILVKTGFIEDDRYIYKATIEKREAARDGVEILLLPYKRTPAEAGVKFTGSGRSKSRSSVG